MARKKDDDTPDETPAAPPAGPPIDPPAPAPMARRARAYKTRSLIKTGHGMIQPNTPIIASDVASQKEFDQMVKDGHIVPLVDLPTDR
jgi:hypothetical protein